jgi:hypothetical protein
VPTYAEWVSTSALGVSVLSAGWQVARARQDRPRIGVSGEISFAFTRPQDRVVYEFLVVVTNYGGRAVTVTEVRWQGASEHGQYSVGRSLDPADVAYSPAAVRGPRLPCRMEPADEATWTVTEDFTCRFTPRELVRPYVDYANRPRRISRRRISSSRGRYGDWFALPDFGTTLAELGPIAQFLAPAPAAEPEPS